MLLSILNNNFDYAKFSITDYKREIDMRTKANNYQVIIDLRNHTASSDEFIKKVVGVIALNDLDKDNPPLATILDFAIEYSDDPTPDDRKKKLAKAILAIIDTL